MDKRDTATTGPLGHCTIRQSMALPSHIPRSSRTEHPVLKAAYTRHCRSLHARAHIHRHTAERALQALQSGVRPVREHELRLGGKIPRVLAHNGLLGAG